MKLFWTLTRVQLRGLLSSIGARNTRRTRAYSAWLILGLFALLALYMSSTYSFTLAGMLAQTGHTDLVLALMPLLGLAFAILLGSQAAGTFVFAGRDNDLLLALPIPRVTLALAKVAAVALQNALIMVCMLAPAGVAYAIHEPTPGWFWPTLVVAALLLALLATAASVLLGLLISLVRNLRQGTAIVNVVGMLLILGLVGGSLAGQVPLLNTLQANPEPVRAWLAAWTPPLLWVRDAAVTFAPTALALLAVTTLVPFALVAWLVGRSFVALVSGASTHRGKVAKADVAGLRVRTPFVALVVREARRFFGSSIYFLNSGFGAAILLLGAGYLFVVREVPAPVTIVAEVLGVTPALLAALASAAMITTVNTTAPSISLEGQRLWIVKTAPLRTSLILGAKVAFNVLLVAPAVLLFAIAAAIATRASLADALILVALPLATAVLLAEIGLAANLTWYNLNAANDTVVVKQSAAVVAALFGGMAVVLVAAFAGLALARPLGASAAFGLVALVLAAAASGLWFVLRTWGVRRFLALG